VAAVYVVFGTESGNAQGLAGRAGEALEKAGVPNRVVDMLDFEPESLASVELLMVITSTYGNGDPPSNAEALHAYLMKKAPPLPNLSFCVFGLGDTTYDRFAQCGKDFDAKLGGLGGKRLLERADTDVDYEDNFEAWLAKAVPVVAAAAASSSKADVRPEVDGSAAVPPPKPSARGQEAPGTRRNPVRARVLANTNLNLAGSTKATHHLSLDVSALPSGYVVGDSIGIWPQNDPELVSAILTLTKLEPSATVTLADKEISLGEALVKKLEIQAPDARLVERAHPNVSSEERQRLLHGEHVIDLLRKDTKPWTPSELVRHLRPMAPRLYSIASSPKAHPGEVHLLVDILRYEIGGEARLGVTSRQVVDRAAVGSELDIYLHPTSSFRLCEPERPIIMIGPGTGVAPFRAFLQERRAQKATGKSWLFFGVRQRATDFLYEADWQGFQKENVLTRIDVAFSRDQAEKIYVQHLMQEHEAELYEWIQNGAAIYVCGEAHQMAPDVEAMLLGILGRQGKLDFAAARQALDKLADQKRYQKDVY
jgi:sulfite reductase (NADPH) flavoprotein alpha-component